MHVSKCLHKMYPKPSNFQNYNFNVDLTTTLLKNSLPIGYHAKGPFLKLLLYQKLIS